MKITTVRKVQCFHGAVSPIFYISLIFSFKGETFSSELLTFTGYSSTFGI